MTDQEIVDKANELAAELYALHGYRVPPGHRFDKAADPAVQVHPHERQAWQGAVIAFALLRDTDVEDALTNLA